MQIASPAATRPPRFDVAFRFEGAGRYSSFVATPRSRPYGEPAGYGSLRDALESLASITAGRRRPAAGIFERDGRFHARALDVRFEFDDQLGGYAGPWRLEQNEHDLAVLRGDEPGSSSRDQALRAIVDGHVTFDAAAIPVG